jgi:cardiolipin synthase
VFTGDETGLRIAEILKLKKAAGLDVRVIVDGLSNPGLQTQWMYFDLKQNGIEVEGYEALALQWLNEVPVPNLVPHTDPDALDKRYHEKLWIIDAGMPDAEAVMGGLNIANEYRGYHRVKAARAWRDTGIFLEGPIVTRLVEEFRKSWQVWSKRPIPQLQEAEPKTYGIPVLPIFASSARSRRRMRRLLYYSINKARKSIYLTTAYFIPSMRLLYILERAAARNVDVKLLLPGISDIPSVYFAGRAFYSRLLKAGVEIYSYNGVILHAKTAVFDSLWSVIGSANLDFQSMRRNDEGNVGIMDEGFGREMTDVFLEDLSRAEKITLEQWIKRPFHEKMREFFFALFRTRL